tara:strand:- start:125 stop:388 length:264 start_codon:yes stop_codon:yes gene_type:complete
MGWNVDKTHKKIKLVNHKKREEALLNLFFRLFYSSESKYNQFADRTYADIEEFFRIEYGGDMEKYIWDADSVEAFWKDNVKEDRLRN